MVNIITIKNDTIPYLDVKIIKSFENVTLISSEGLTIKMNSLLLGAMSHSLKMAFHEAYDDEYTISTEFCLQELVQIKQFFMTGSCDAMNKSLLKSFGIKIMPTFGFLKNATGAAVNESASEILKDVNEIKKNNLPIIEHPNRKLTKITSAVLQPIDKITLAETEKKPNNVSIEHPDRQITKITAKLFYEECIQCGLRGKQASSNYSSHYVQNNLLYATAIHSLSCGPGPLHNNECAKCYQKLSSFKAYQEHVKDQHEGKWTYRCGYCPIPEIFDSKQDCLDHTNFFHGGKMNKKFKPKINDNKDAEEEIEIKKYNCQYCEKEFESKKVMYQHIKKEHEAEVKGPRTCEKCPNSRVFFGVQKLKIHQNYVHNETTCEICGKLTTVGNLGHHNDQYHTANEDKKHKCPTCSRGFVNKQARDDHINVHTGEKPHKCINCPATFASVGTLAMHHRAHLGIKRKPKPKLNVPDQSLPCQKCGKIFKGGAKLKIHEQHYHIESQCALCGIMVTNVKMKFHIRKHHKNTN